MPAPFFFLLPLLPEGNRQGLGLAPAALRGGLVARFSTGGAAPATGRKVITYRLVDRFIPPKVDRFIPHNSINPQKSAKKWKIPKVDRFIPDNYS